MDEEQLKEFDKKFRNFEADADGGGIVWNGRLGQGEALKTSIKSFISSLLQEQKKQLRSLVEEIKLPPSKHPHPIQCTECKEAEAYNAAINDVLSLI